MDISRQQASEDALRQSEAELKMITDALPVLIGYLDHKERFRFNNRYYTEWFGYPTQWLLGKTAREVLGEQGYAEREQSIRAALAGQQVVFEAYSPHRDGQARRMLVHYLPRRDAQGAVLGFFVMALTSLSAGAPSRPCASSTRRWKAASRSAPRRWPKSTSACSRRWPAANRRRKRYVNRRRWKRWAS